MVGRKDAFVAPRPCSRMTGSPEPASIVEISPSAVWTGRSFRRPGPVGGAVAARNPTPRWRSRRTLRRPLRNAVIPSRTSSAIAFQVSGSALSTASAPPAVDSVSHARPCSMRTSRVCAAPSRRSLTRRGPTSNTEGSNRETSRSSGEASPGPACAEVPATFMGVEVVRPEGLPESARG